MSFENERRRFCQWFHSGYGEPRWSKKVQEAHTVEDLWHLFRKRVPPVVSEYFRGGADRELTLRANSLAWQEALTTAWGLRSQDGKEINTQSEFAGVSLTVPWTISPVGSLALLYPKADAIAAKVAGNYGTLMAQSTLSGTAMEEVCAASSHSCAFQLYLCGGRDASLRRIERAKKAGFRMLMVTIDTAEAGNRVEHARMRPVEALSTLSGNFRVAPQMLCRPSWVASHYAGGGMITFLNVELDDGSLMEYTDIASQLKISATTWEDIPWILRAWQEGNPNGTFVVKGVHCAEDAKRAEDLGAHGIVWSNHGGRQQDGVPSTLQMLEEEMPKMQGSRLQFMVDGGIRDGRAVLLALSYGVHAVGLGRVSIAGIGSGGEAGLTKAFDLIQAGFEKSMRLVGVRSVKEIHERGLELRRTQLYSSCANTASFVF